MGILEQCNSIPTYSPETFTYEDLIRCIYELFNYLKMNDQENTTGAYTLSDSDVAEILNNTMVGTTDTNDSEETVSTEVASVDFEEPTEILEDDTEESEEENEDEDDEGYTIDSSHQEELTMYSSIQRIKKILEDNHDEEHSRFKGASWYDVIRQKVIMLAGVGGIGRII